MKATPIWPAATSLTASTTPLSLTQVSFLLHKQASFPPQDMCIGYSHWNVLKLDGFMIVAEAFQVTFSSEAFSTQNKNFTSAQHGGTGPRAQHVGGRGRPVSEFQARHIESSLKPLAPPFCFFYCRL